MNPPLLVAAVVAFLPIFLDSLPLVTYLCIPFPRHYLPTSSKDLSSIPFHFYNTLTYPTLPYRNLRLEPLLEIIYFALAEEHRGRHHPELGN